MRVVRRNESLRLSRSRQDRCRLFLFQERPGHFLRKCRLVRVVRRKESPRLSRSRQDRCRLFLFQERPGHFLRKCRLVRVEGKASA